MKGYNLKELGFNETLAKHRIEKQLDQFEVGRVILEHKERYIVLSESGEMEGELIGNLRFTAQSRADFPAVGDWVAFTEYDVNKGLIHAVYPRFNALERQAAGGTSDKQIIAANIDTAFIVQSVNRDYSINRLERYITICHSSRIEPIIILSKIDLIDEVELNEIRAELSNRIQGIPLLFLSNLTSEGVPEVLELVKPGETYCFLGSSGVGKSSLINGLSGDPMMKTGEISGTINRGKHVTTHRELIHLPSGGLLIDNPGMREVGIADSSAGLAQTFEQIYDLAHDCKFKDCRHVNEHGCAVIEALDSGVLNQETYQNYLKLEREQARFSESVHEKRRKEKTFGKMVKEIKSHKKRTKG